MKYIKLYEAFKSRGISNTLKFLKEKVGKSASDSFVVALQNFMTSIDYPIDKLSDDTIKYMSAKKAIALKSEKEVSNFKGIWVLKYWFSLEKGFLGYTATGNETKPFIERGGNQHNGLRDAEPFGERELDYIKNRITRTGEIWPVTDYKMLKTGDSVIGQFDSSDYSHIALAKIFVDHNDNHRVYAIQNVSAGSEPSDSNWRNYQQLGSLSWWIWDNSDMGYDHRKLHFFRPSSEEIHYIEPPVEKKEEKDTDEVEEPLEWNLPLSNRFVVSSWGRTQYSIDSSQNVKEADFALVLYFDDIINSSQNDYVRPSQTRQQRQTEKEGATKLLTDEDIKKMNIERYIQKLVVSLNITESEFFNLEKIVSKHLAQEFSYISILSQRPDWGDISDFTDYLYRVVDCSQEEKSYYINRVKELYTNRTKKYYEQLMKYQKNKSFIKGNTNLKNLFDEIFKLGSEINSLFTKQQIDSIDDLFIVRKKINTFYEYIRMERNKLSYSVREIFSAFRYTDEMEHYFQTYSERYTTEEYSQDLEKLKRISNFIKSL